MSENWLARLGAGLAVGALLVSGCGSSGGGGGGGTAHGTTAVVMKDGPVQVVGDTRTIDQLVVDVTQIVLEVADDPASGDTDPADGMGGGGMDDPGGDNHGGGNDVVVFDAVRDNGGAPKSFDLLTLTDTSILLNTLPVPVGTYDTAKVKITGASAEFTDAPGTLAPLVLGGDGDDDTQFEFQLDPAVTVDATSVTVAQIDFVPVVTFDGQNYVLSHDGESDQSGECDGEAELEHQGTISSVSADHNTIHLDGLPLAIDVSTVAGKDSLTVGEAVEVKGHLDTSTGVFVATSVDAEDSTGD